MKPGAPVPRHRRRRRQRRRIVLGWSLAGTAIILILGGLMLRDAVLVARTLFDASDALREARTAVAHGDVVTADQVLARTRGDLIASKARTNRLLWKGFERVPLMGRSLTTARLLVSVADEGAAVGRAVLLRHDVVIDDEGNVRVGLDGRRLTLPPLMEGAAALAEVDRARLVSSLDRLRATPVTWVPEVVRSARRDALAIGDEITFAIERAQDLLDVVPGFSGVDGARRYFLAMQNNAEVRGTGGLIGFFSMLTVENGEFTISDPVTYDVIERPGQIDAGLARPEVPPGFDERYGAADASGFVANVNLDPDLPTVAPVLLGLAERRLGVSLDGAVFIDPIGLARALSNVGPVHVPEEFTDPQRRIPNPVPAADLPRVTMRDAYEVFGGNTEARDDYLRELATAAFELLFNGGWQPIPVSHDIAAAALSRHLQLFSRHPEEQGAFEALGVAGRLAPVDGTDFTAVTAVNSAANKLDLYTRQSIDVEVRFDGDPKGDPTRLVRVQVTADNQAPADSLGIYVAGSAPIDRSTRFAPRDGPHGLNRTWYTVWGPASASALRTQGPDGATVPTIADVIHDTVAVDSTMTMLAGESSGFAVDLTGPGAFIRDGPDLIYRFVVRRQPRATVDDLRVTLVAPSTWEIAEVSATRSAEALLPAAGGDLEVVHDLRTMEVSGSADSDVVLQVRFTRSLGTRFDTWMRNLLN